EAAHWFGSNVIITLAVVAAVCLTALVIYSWRKDDPIVAVRLFRHANFSIASTIMFMVGALSFASTVLMPQFLQTQLGYTAQKAGLVLSVAAVFLLVELPIVGQLTTKIQARYLIATGYFLLACAMYFSTQRLSLSL